jgi:hypothetical protein
VADIKVGIRAAMKRYEEKPPADRRSPEAMPTRRQYTVLQTLASGWKMTAKQICVRSDVLWRMEERGWVARTYASTLTDKWFIRPAGKAAIERYEER